MTYCGHCGEAVRRPRPLAVRELLKMEPPRFCTTAAGAWSCKSYPMGGPPVASNTARSSGSVVADPARLQRGAGLVRPGDRADRHRYQQRARAAFEPAGLGGGAVSWAMSRIPGMARIISENARATRSGFDPDRRNGPSARVIVSSIGPRARGRGEDQRHEIDGEQAGDDVDGRRPAALPDLEDRHRRRSRAAGGGGRAGSAQRHPYPCRQQDARRQEREGPPHAGDEHGGDAERGEQAELGPAGMR